METTTERVWETFHVPLQQFIRRRVSDETAAEDLLQDVFLDIHQHIDTLRDVKKLESWIYQVTRNAIIDYYRSKRTTTTLDAPEALHLRAGSAWPHHRLSTTLRLLHDGRLLCRGSHSSEQERTCASFLKKLRLPE